MNKGLANFLDGQIFGHCSYCNHEQVVSWGESFKCDTCGRALRKIDLSREEKKCRLEEPIKAYECKSCGYMGVYEEKDSKVCRNCGSKVEKVSLIWRESQYEARKKKIEYWRRILQK
mgnify:FL=1